MKRLKSDSWNKTEGLLEESNEVTVNGEMFGEEVNEDSYCATVTEVLADDMYEVTDANNEITIHHRRDLRFREKHSVAMGHVTDDKSHDRHAMQHFTKHELAWSEDYMNENFPNYIPTGRIQHIQIYVQWYEKIDVNSDESKYHVSRTITVPQVQNNQLLLHAGFEMHRLRGESNSVPRSRPTSARRQSSQSSSAASLGDYARPTRTVKVALNHHGMIKIMELYGR